MYMSNVVFVQVKCCLCTSQMLYLYKSIIVFVQVKCRLCTSQMSSLNKSNVVFVQVRCRLCTSQMSSLCKIKRLTFLPSYFVSMDVFVLASPMPVLLRLRGMFADKKNGSIKTKQKQITKTRYSKEYG